MCARRYSGSLIEDDDEEVEGEVDEDEDDVGDAWDEDEAEDDEAVDIEDGEVDEEAGGDPILQSYKASRSLKNARK